MNLYLIRHGETEWNASSRAQGSKNIALSDKGRQQAELLARRMKSYKIDHIYSSDLDRAFETAKIVGNKLNLPVEKNEKLREMCFGEWEGLTNQEISSSYTKYYTLWRSRPHEAHIPGGERLIDVQNRSLQAVNYLLKKHPAESIAIFSHGVTIKSILLGILDIDLSYFYKIKQDNTAINQIEFREYGPIIVRLNDTYHLENNDAKGE